MANNTNNTQDDGLRGGSPGNNAPQGGNTTSTAQNSGSDQGSSGASSGQGSTPPSGGPSTAGSASSGSSSNSQAPASSGSANGSGANSGGVSGSDTGHLLAQGIPVLDTGSGSGLGLGGLGGVGALNNGLVPELVADAQSIGANAVNDLQVGGNNLPSDAIAGADQLVTQVADNADNAGLGGIAGYTLAGVTGNLGNGIVGDAVADTQSLGSHVVGDLSGDGGNLVNDAVAGADALLNHAADNLGLGDVVGDTPLGGITGSLGNGLVPDADTQSLGSHVVGDLSGDGGNLLGDGGNLVNDAVAGTDTLVNHAADNLGLGDVVGDNPLGGITGGVGSSLIPDAAADTQSLGSNVVGDLSGDSGNLLSDAVAGTDNLVNHAADNLGVGSGINVGNLTSGLGNGIDVGNLTGALGNGIDTGGILGSGTPLTASVLGGGDSALAQPLHDATGGVTDSLLGAPSGDSPIIDLGAVTRGSPDVMSVANAADGAGNGVLSGLGVGQIADVTADGSNGGNPAVSATAGNDPGDNGPLVDTHVFGDNSGASNNLINAGAGPDGGTGGSSSDVIANVLGGTPDSANPLAQANVIDTGMNGAQVANADVLTTPDQFHFPALEGTGTDALANTLNTDAGHTVATLVPEAAAPTVDLGTQPIVDLNLTGDASSHTDNPVQTALHGQLLGAA
jgi:hypothetical protein